MRHRSIIGGISALPAIVEFLKTREAALRPEIVSVASSHATGRAIRFKTADGMEIELPRRYDLAGNCYGFPPQIAWTYAWGKVTHVDTLDEYIRTLN